MEMYRLPLSLSTYKYKYKVDRELVVREKTGFTASLTANGNRLA